MSCALKVSQTPQSDDPRTFWLSRSSFSQWRRMLLFAGNPVMTVRLCSCLRMRDATETLSSAFSVAGSAISYQLVFPLRVSWMHWKEGSAVSAVNAPCNTARPVRTGSSQGEVELQDINETLTMMLRPAFGHVWSKGDMVPASQSRSHAQQ